MVLRVLVVDDNDHDLELAAVLLRGRGHVVDTASQATDVESLDPSDVVLMDISMPIVDGVTLMHRMRDRGWQNVLFIALTSHVGGDDVRRFVSEGFDAHLRKPIDTRWFARQIEAVCSEVRAPVSG